MLGRPHGHALLARCAKSRLAVQPPRAQRLARFAHTDVVVTVHILDREGNRDQVQGKVGESLYDVAARGNELSNYIECACAGKMLCSTCHVYVEEKPSGLPGPTEEELDLIDLAYEPRPESRLGCQIHLRPESEGLLTIRIPGSAVNHFR
jgi:ferredoxin